MADRILFTGFRVRVADENFDVPSQYRLRFYDSSTDDVKKVYDGPEASDISLGTIVDLDSEGYGPVSGIWLDPGYYKVIIQKALIDDPIDDQLDWEDIWAIPKVFGGEDTSTDSDNTFQIVTTVANIRGINDPEGMAFNTGYYDMNDGGQGEWMWMPYSTQTDDGGAYLLPTGQSTAVAGRWHRVFDSSPEINVRLWGAIPGQGNVASNIEKADQFCASINDDSGKTLAFPSGQYNIGVTNLNLNRSGSFNDLTETKVFYHFYENAVILTTGSLTITGTAKIDGNSLVCEKLIIVNANVNNGYARSEWWGAVGDDGITDCSTPFINCWDGIGSHTLILSGQYVIKSDEAEIDGAIVNLHFIGHTSYIKSLYSLTTYMNVGKITVEYTHQIFYTSVSAFILHEYDYKLSELGVYTGSGYEPSGVITDIVAQSGDNKPTLICDTTIDWIETTYNFSENVTFVFNRNTIWNVDNCTLIINSSIFEDNSQSFYFESISSTGTINLVDQRMYNPDWFNAIGDAKDKEFKSLLTSVVEYNKTVDFNNQEVTISSMISLVPAGLNTITTIKNLELTCTDTLVNGLFFTVGSSSKLNFDNCVFNHYNDTATQAALGISGGLIKVTNCAFTGGLIGMQCIDLDFYNNNVLSSQFELTSNPITVYSQTIKSSLFINSKIILSSNDTELSNISIIDNSFTQTNVNAGNAFIYLQATQALTGMSRVRILNNNYDYPGMVGTGTYGATTDADLMISVLDATSGLSETWSLEQLDIVVADKQVSASVITKLSPNYTVGPHYPSTNVFTHNTDGIFSVTNDETTSTSFSIETSIAEQLILNGRAGRIVVVSINATAKNNVVMDDPYHDGKPAVAGSYAQIGNAAYNDIVLIAVNYPEGVPFDDGYGGYTDGITVVTGQFVKIFGSIS